MQSFPEHLIFHLTDLVDKADVAHLASSCLWMCRVCRLVHGRRLRLSGNQGRELFAVPSNRAFSSCRSLQYMLHLSPATDLLHDSLATDVMDLQLAVASAALKMPHLHEMRIILLEDFSAAHDEPQRQAVQSCIRALQHLQHLQKLSCSLPSCTYWPGLQSLPLLTALTALQLGMGKAFKLPASVAQLCQLRQLQLSGAILPQLEEGAAPDLRLPSSLTGLTFLALGLDWARPWVWQLQHCGDSIRSLEVQPDAFSSSLFDLLSSAAELRPVLPQLTKIVFREVFNQSNKRALRAPGRLQPNDLFPSLQCFQMLDRKPWVDNVFCGEDLLVLSGCSQRLCELSWVGYWGVHHALPSDLVFPQLTSLKVESLFMFAGDGGYDIDSIDPWPGEEAPGSSSVMHKMFPALQVLTVGRCATWDNELMSAAAAGLARCTGITRLVLRLESGAASCSVKWFKVVAGGLNSLQQLEVLLEHRTLDAAAALASWPSQAVAGVAAFTQLQGLRIESPPWKRPHFHDLFWRRRCARWREARPEAARNMQLALLQLLPLQQLQRLELCNIAGVSAAVLATLTAQLPALQLLQLHGCSEGPDESVQQWHTAVEAAAASSSGAAGGLEGGMWSRLQHVRAGLRPGVKLVALPSSWPAYGKLYW